MNGIDRKDALSILKIDRLSTLLEVFKEASAVRENFSGNKITTCAIINAKCGNCGENCAFCAQSSRSKAPIQTWPMVEPEKIFEAARDAEKAGVSRFGIVTAGTKVAKGHDLDVICQAVEAIGRLKIKPCASLGIVEEEVLTILRNAGLTRYHHNLEAAESFFKEVCTSRPYSSQIRTVELAKETGLTVCSGGIFGLGESLEQRIELLDTVRRLEVDSVPLNFLSPIPGTLLEKGCGLTAMDCLKVIAAARLMMPRTSIRVCGGREKNLRDLQSWIFAAGADSFMTGGYLVTPGRGTNPDAQMISDCGLEPE